MIEAIKANEALARADLSGFIGEWVALEGERVVAHGKDFRGVYAGLKNAPNRAKLLFARVPGRETWIG